MLSTGLIPGTLATMLPNFLVIGAEKCGTTWLHAVLRAHPEIFVPPTKEIHYFNRLDSNLRERDSFRRGLNWYERFFADWSGERHVGEVTPLYMCDPVAPQRIAETLPDVRLVCLLRHPVDRAYAHYWMARAKGHESRSFDEVVAARDPRFIERGFYARQLSGIIDRFGRGRVAILVFEETVDDPGGVLGGLGSWLGASAEGFAASAAGAENTAARYPAPALTRWVPAVARAMQRHPLTFRLQASLKASGLPDWIKKRNRRAWQYPALDRAVWLDLADYYRADMELLEELLGRPVDRWRRLETAHRQLPQT